MSQNFFEGKVVIVTGSSNGIGRAAAALFASRGAKLLITGRDPATLKVTREQCLAANGGKESEIAEVIGDLGNEEVAKKIVEEAVRSFGQIDVLVNNAGMMAGLDEGKMPDPNNVLPDLAEYDRTMAVNMRANIVLVQLAIPHLEKTRGAIVNISSIAALPFSASTDPYYPISKAALDQFTVQLAFKLIKKGIRVNSVNPGAVETNFGGKVPGTEQLRDILKNKVESDGYSIPLGRIGTPDDIAKLIVFLADRSQSEFIVGQRIVADGGSVLANCALTRPLF